MAQEFFVQTELKFSAFFADLFRKSGRKFKDLKEDMPEKIGESKKSVAAFYQNAKEKLTNFSSQTSSSSPAGPLTSSPSSVPAARLPLRRLGSRPSGSNADPYSNSENYARSSGKINILDYFLLISFVLICKF